MHDITKATGTTSRTLRYYDEIGLLAPSRVGQNGYRYYDEDALLRLQRILLLRELGLGLSSIADVLEGQRDTRSALEIHRDLLRQERDRIDRQIAAVTTTLHKKGSGEELMVSEVFDGFDHTQHKDEVIRRWGESAYAKSDSWWRSLSRTQQREFQQRHDAIVRDYSEARRAGLDPASEEVRAVAGRHHEWLATASGEVSRAYFLGLADLYVEDERFAATYGGAAGASFVRSAMRAYAEDAGFSGQRRGSS